VEAIENALRAGALDDDGGAARNLVVALDVVVAGGESREGGANCRDVQVDVRTAELLVLLYGVWRSCTSRSALQEI
jgi:hypothetical protein